MQRIFYAPFVTEPTVIFLHCKIFNLNIDTKSFQFIMIFPKVYLMIINVLKYLKEGKPSYPFSKIVIKTTERYDNLKKLIINIFTQYLYAN